MNPRSLTRFLKSKFGLFVIFVAVLFTGLWIYSRHQAGVREAEKLAAQNRKKVELGQMRMPLNQGLENGLPQQARPAGESTNEKPAPGNGIVPFRPAVPPPPRLLERRLVQTRAQPRSRSRSRARSASPPCSRATTRPPRRRCGRSRRRPSASSRSARC